MVSLTPLLTDISKKRLYILGTAKKGLLILESRKLTWNTAVYYLFIFW
jgi:hypothetical protein